MVPRYGYGPIQSSSRRIVPSPTTSCTFAVTETIEMNLGPSIASSSSDGSAPECQCTSASNT